MRTQITVPQDAWDQTNAFRSCTFLESGGRDPQNVQVKTGHVFFSQGGLADAIFFLDSGRAKLTVVSKRGKVAMVTDEHVVGYYKAGDRMKRWGKMGAFWGLLFGAGMFAITGIGPILVA